MAELDEDVGVFGTEMGGGTFGKVSRTVLASGAAETDHQMVEAALNIIVHRHVNNVIHLLFEAVHLFIAFQIFLHTGILA